MRDTVTLRPIGREDEPFLFNVFTSVHGPTLAMADLPEEQVKGLLRMQFTAQHSQYQSQYPSADFDIVLVEGAAAGCLYALRGPEDFVLIDISLLPDYRNSGIGTSLVADLINQAKHEKRPLTAHVRKDNPAWRLWQKLGFEAVGDDGVFLQIRVPFEH
jgi:ribosomal protein S18 acetylase RimI-like enzyme